MSKLTQIQNSDILVIPLLSLVAVISTGQYGSDYNAQKYHVIIICLGGLLFRELHTLGMKNLERHLLVESFDLILCKAKSLDNLASGHLARPI